MINTSTPLIFHIQRFSIHDGPGIRTTIFFKGCPLSCPWCHNPESQKFEQEILHKEDGTCQVVGQYYDVDEVIQQVGKDQIFYERSGGGVTLSGGEVMAQSLLYIVELIKKLHNKGITIGIDTSGAVSFFRFEQVMPYIDFFLYDIKLFNAFKHRQYIGIDNDGILSNLQKLSIQGASLYLRLIMIENINMDLKEDVKPLLCWLHENHIKVKKVHLLPYHTLGKNKYNELGRKAIAYGVPRLEELKKIQELFKQEGYVTVIGG